MERAVILEAARTPFGKFGGALSSLSAPELGGAAIREAIERARILTTLLYEPRRRGGGRGLAAICSGRGQGDAVLVEV